MRVLRRALIGLLLGLAPSCEEGVDERAETGVPATSRLNPESALLSPPHRELKTRIDDEFVKKWARAVPVEVDSRLAETLARDPLAAVINGAFQRNGFGDSERLFATQVLLHLREYEAMASILFELPEEARGNWMAHFLNYWNQENPAAAAAWVESLRERSPALFQQGFSVVARRMVETNLELFREAMMNESKPDWERELAGRVTTERITVLEGTEAALEIIGMLPKKMRPQAREGMLNKAFSGEESLPLIRELILSTPLDEVHSLDNLFGRIERGTSVRVAMQFADELRAIDRNNPELASAMRAPYDSWARKDWEGAVEWLFATENLTSSDRKVLARTAMLQAQRETAGLNEYLPQLEAALGKETFGRLAARLVSRDPSEVDEEGK